jgi:hypothetical protein
LLLILLLICWYLYKKCCPLVEMFNFITWIKTSKHTCRDWSHATSGSSAFVFVNYMATYAVEGRVLQDLRRSLHCF